MIDVPKLYTTQSELNLLRISAAQLSSALGSSPSDERVDAYYLANKTLIDQYILMARPFISAAERYIDEIVRNVT